jgi:pyroglutamyl-peptidase
MPGKQCAVCGTQNPPFSSNAKMNVDYCRGCQQIQPFVPLGTPVTTRVPVVEEAKETKHVVFHLTGFGPFHGVQDNPTSTLMHTLPSYLEEETLPDHITVRSFTIFETSAQGSVETLEQLHASEHKHNSSDAQLADRHVVHYWVHFGVNGAARQIVLESQAFNEATFRCPDERGQVFMNQPIIDAPEAKTCLQSQVDTKTVVSDLRSAGHAVGTSNDAGRFVCNWIYYQSLYRTLKLGSTHQSLFVHVPPFKQVDDRAQLRFARALLLSLADKAQS